MEDNNIIRLYENGNRKHYTVFDSTLHTIRYEFEDIADNSKITAEQAEDKIILSGLLKGKKIYTEQMNDAVKWSQSITYTLSRFSLSDKEEEVFRIFRPDNFEPVIFKAIKTGLDTLEINKRKIPVKKISLRPKGIKSVFWKGEYSFRNTDGLFIKYVGKNGGPGSPETVIILKE